MWDIVITELRELAVTVLVALLSLGAAYALSYIRRAKEALDQRIDHELADRALERVAHLAEVFVLATESKRSEEHTSELQSRENLVCRLLLEKKKQEQL